MTLALNLYVNLRDVAGMHATRHPTRDGVDITNLEALSMSDPAN